MGRWLVTGGAGFIGSNLVTALVLKGHKVRVVDSLVTGKMENLSSHLDDIEMIKGDLADPEVCKKSVKDVEVVLHQAALGSVPRSVADPLTTHTSNITATVNLLIAARDAGVRRFVVASSSSVYGANPVLPKKEDLLTMPMSPYAVTKLAQEQYTMAFHAVYKMETVALRYFNIYGPRQAPDSQYAAVIPNFVSAALSNKAPLIHGDGEQTRDFTFVEDCVRANLLAATTPEAVGHYFNIAGGGEISINKLWEEIAGIVGATVQPEHDDPRAGDVRKSRADVSLAKEVLGWEPQVELSEGLKKTVEWMKK